ncbi:MAG: HAMP domain-containing sensor histidine kinase, partial [Pontixanthobacter sp.]
TPRRGPQGGCDVAIRDWRTEHENDQDGGNADRLYIIDRAASEFIAKLDEQQRILDVENEAEDLKSLTNIMTANAGKPWTDFVELYDIGRDGDLHWRLLDKAECRVEGSNRKWRVALHPINSNITDQLGFELLLIADTALDLNNVVSQEKSGATMKALGKELLPVLHTPIDRIVANAETIRAKMAGPLAGEYSDYAADITAAGQHLLALVEDFSDLQLVEDPDFVTNTEEVEIIELVRRAAGMLAVRADRKNIDIIEPNAEHSVIATGDARRVLQIVLNLLSNAIHYSPENTLVSIECKYVGRKVTISIRDEGPGLTDRQMNIMFDKFERLGRNGNGGSGLGLYISRKLARAMGGNLTVKSAPGEGARFTLDLPAGENRLA